MKSPLGQLNNIDVRSLWQNEAYDFTPWLAEEANLALLGSALGLELELENTEVSVGPYSADILAKDTGTGKYVVIENQLEKTDHDHLGKSITYAAVLDASTVVWIAPYFTDEHEKALTWLNDHSSDELAFFGVRLELWQIDDSRPSVRFDIVSQPADIVRQAIKSGKSGKLSETQKLQLDFWTAVRDELRNQDSIPSVQSPRPQYWYDVSLGRSGIHLSNTASISLKKIGVRVYISNTVGDEALVQLMEQKDRIEGEIGKELVWNPNPENRDKTIALERPADLAACRENWDEYVKWMVEMTVQFRKSFSPKVKALDLSKSLAPEPEEESEDSVNYKAKS